MFAPALPCIGPTSTRRPARVSAAAGCLYLRRASWVRQVLQSGLEHDITNAQLLAEIRRIRVAIDTSPDAAAGTSASSLEAKAQTKRRRWLQLASGDSLPTPMVMQSAGDTSTQSPATSDCSSSVASSISSSVSTRDSSSSACAEGACHVSDFSCPLCMKLLYEPVTTACGHSFCRECLVRCLDHNNGCPLCRTVLHVSSRKPPVSVSLQNILNKQFPQQTKERETEASSEKLPVPCVLPLFVVDHVMPGQVRRPRVSRPRTSLPRIPTAVISRPQAPSARICRATTDSLGPRVAGDSFERVRAAVSAYDEALPGG